MTCLWEVYSNIGGSFELQAKYYRFPAKFLNFSPLKIQKTSGKSVISCLKFKRATYVGVCFSKTSHRNLECSLSKWIMYSQVCMQNGLSMIQIGTLQLPKAIRDLQPKRKSLLKCISNMLQIFWCYHQPTHTFQKLFQEGTNPGLNWNFRSEF